jgi:TRAP-type mannitol/chloroaromatic compound transport system substrate-binding protein
MNSMPKGGTRSISRRYFAQLAAVGAAMAAARPAIAQQTSETVKWRLTSSFPKNLDTLYGAANTICRVVGELTDGKFSIQPLLPARSFRACRFSMLSPMPRSNAARPTPATTSARSRR